MPTRFNVAHALSQAAVIAHDCACIADRLLYPGAFGLMCVTPAGL